MAKTLSTMLDLETEIPSFALTDGLSSEVVKTSDIIGKNGILVMFICNHCPYVIHVIDPLVKLMKEMQQEEIGVVAINSNDVIKYPDDSPQLMKEFAEKNGFSFPYLFDVSQKVAHSYQAACTPDFFLFDASGKLYYRGQMDAARPGNSEINDGKDLRNAMEAMLALAPSPETQVPSMGCNIKWKEGNAPNYF